MIKFTLNGVQAQRSRLIRIANHIPKEFGRALREETEIEATECKRRTPVRYGHLRDSIHVEGPLIDRDGIHTKIVCGGVSAPYAIYVHENLEAFHPVGQAKFIESVILESRPYLGARVAARIDLNRATY